MENSLYSQVLEAIDAAFSERVMSQLQLSLEGLARGLNAKVDLRSP